jgi:hypothetical protein
MHSNSVRQNYCPKPTAPPYVAGAESVVASETAALTTQSA